MLQVRLALRNNNQLTDMKEEIELNEVQLQLVQWRNGCGTSHYRMWISYTHAVHSVVCLIACSLDDSSTLVLSESEDPYQKERIV